MGIGREFRFSQSNLQSYDRCCRRFYLHYIDELEWPAPITDSEDQWEAAAKRGQLFHLLVHQESLGIDVAPTVEASSDPQLGEWWDNFKRFAPKPEVGERVLSEVELTAGVGGFSIVAKFDRITLPDHDEAVLRIFDWKTGRRAPKQLELERSWQTVVYRYVFAEVGGSLFWENGVSVDPRRIEILYWHAGFPHAIQPISYSAAEHEEAGERLRHAIDEIVTLSDRAEGQSAFARTEDEERCRHCCYRAYCERERTPGAFVEWELSVDGDEVEEEGSTEMSPVEKFGNV